MNPPVKSEGFLFEWKVYMYWLETKSTEYNGHDGQLFSNYQEAIYYYHFLIESMMRNLPKEDWFDLKLMRHGKDGDFMPEREQVVRSWVY